MEALRAIVVDDESLARKGLRIRLEQITGIEIVGESRRVRGWCV